MTYDPLAYWQNAGANRDARDHESHFVRTEVFAKQEQQLLATLQNLDFGSILEVGCGWGRITKLVHERWPDVPYTAVDLSADRLESAKAKAPGVKFVQSTIEGYHTTRRFDLVLAVEILMHVPPSEIEAAVEKLCGLSKGYVVSVDWSESLGDKPIAPWNALFDYRALYGSRLVSEERIALQSIYVARVEP